MATGVKAPALPVIKRRVRGGVPVYVVDGPAPARCALMFRVGRSDETLLTGGVTHLVEHLALFPLGDQPYQYNGFVDSHRTVFHAAGRAEECVEFLASVTGALADLPMHRLEHEHRVLDAEAAGHGSGLFGALVTYRFGPRGLGMLGYPQIGARALTAPQVDAWRAERFTSGNAALVVSGVPVEWLRLDLPPGDRQEPVMAPTVEPELPAWFTSPASAVGMSMVADRGAGLSAAMRILERRLVRRLRTEMAIVYQVAVSAQYLDARRLHVVVGCDPVLEHASAAVDMIREELDRLATDGPDPAEVEKDRSGLQREWEDPNAGYAVADLLATDELLGAERRTPAAITKAVQAVTPAHVARALDEARETALWGVPDHVGGISAMRRVSTSSPGRAEGRRLRPSQQAVVEGQRPDARLIVGERAVGVEFGDDGRVHVEYDRCAAALSWGDGARVLYGDDGFVVALRPWEWKDGAQAVAAVDAHVDPALVLDMGQGTGPPPPRAPEDDWAYMPAWKRWARLVGGMALVVVLLVSLGLPFTTPNPKAGDVKGLPVELLPATVSGFVPCRGSNLSTVLNGAELPEAVPAWRALERACEAEARSQLLRSSVGFVGGLGTLVWVAHRRRRWAAIPTGR